MADETNQTEPGDTPAGVVASPDNIPDTDFGPDGQPFDAERAKSLIQKLRGEARQATKQLKELETLKAERAQAEQAKLSDQEKLTQKLAQTEAELTRERAQAQERALEWEVTRVASQLGVVDPDAAWKLLDRAELDLDAQGRVTNAEAVLGDLVKQKPYLIGQTAVAAQTVAMNPTNPPRQTILNAKPTYTRDQFLDAPFYRDHRADMMAALKEGRIAG